ncbi:MAG: phosphate ABC transporter permease subunit PstC [Geminicoccaceae bacterium]
MLIPLAVLALAATAYLIARQRALAVAWRQPGSLQARPTHHAWYAALVVAGPALALWAVWRLLLEPTLLDALLLRLAPPELVGASPELAGLTLAAVRQLALGAPYPGEVTHGLRAAAELYATLHLLSHAALLAGILALATGGLAYSLRRLTPAFPARAALERWIDRGLWLAAALSVAISAGIVLSVLAESLRFFQRVPPAEFLLGLHWSPQIALRADQIGASGAFGVLPLLAGTLLIAAVALAVAGPLGMLAAIYLSSYASPALRALAKPMLEVLAGIPTVVWGFVAALTVAPWVRRLGEALGFATSAQSALAAGLVLGLMILPFVSSLVDDALGAVPPALRDGSLALGATRAETIARILVPAAMPGIMAAFLLAVSRAVGETMIVVMAAGLAANLTANPLASVTTITVQIVTLLAGDQAFDSAKTLAAFALGLVLFTTTLLLNLLALRAIRAGRTRHG